MFRKFSTKQIKVYIKKKNKYTIFSSNNYEEKPTLYQSDYKNLEV